MRVLKEKILFFVVFLTGAAVLIVEVTATRILAPYFGNTIYTVSSVISVILAALSFGYYYGGRLADRRPSFVLFYGIILGSGFAVFIVEILNLAVLPLAGQSYSIVWGPLVSSFALFFAPSFLLGMLSPFAVKLESVVRPHHGIGKVAGEIFFWSTFGSIGGSLLAGFVLIPQFGVSEIIVVVGWALMILGFIGMEIVRRTPPRMLLGIIAAFLILLTLFAYYWLRSRPGPLVRYNQDGTYEKILIYDGLYHDRPTRFLVLDRDSSAAQFFDSDEPPYDYTKYFEVYKVFSPNPARTLVLGAGAYSISKAILSSAPSATVDVVDIEPRLYPLAKQFFRLPDYEPRLRNYVEDGRRFLAQATSSYDLIFGDVYYSLLSVPSHFTTREFFALAREKLSEGGVFVGNFIGSLTPQNQSLTFSEMRTFREAFPNSYFFAVSSPLLTGIQNVIFVGMKSDKKFNIPLAAQEKRAEGEIIGTLPDKLINIDKYNLARYAELTDDYAPVEYLVSSIIAKIH